VTYTGSRYAARLLEDWPSLQRRIVRVMPREYKKAIAADARRKQTEEATATAVA
jgi:glutamate synthase domain-containing protein 3